MGAKKQDVAAPAKDVDGDNTSAWEEKGQRITVTEGGGFLYKLTLHGKVDSAPDEIYDILTDPNTVSIFRSIKECTYRRVVEQDGKGRRKLEIGHRALARFLFISISFETHLYVWEDDVARTIRFQMAKPGLMQKFDGCWTIRPFSQRALDEAYHPERGVAPAVQHGLFGANNLLGFLQPKAAAPTDSLVTLEQSILPRGPTPPGIKGLVRGLCAHQVRCMMEDLRKELQRRKDGTSTVVNNRKAHGTGKETALPLASKAASITAAGYPRLWSERAPLHFEVQL